MGYNIPYTENKPSNFEIHFKNKFKIYEYILLVMTFMY